MTIVTASPPPRRISSPDDDASAGLGQVKGNTLSRPGYYGHLPIQLKFAAIMLPPYYR